MSRPAPKFTSVVIVPGVEVKIRNDVIEVFPDAPAFIRDTVRESAKKVNLATAMMYARRIAVVTKKGRLHHPDLCTYEIGRAHV